MWLRKGLKEIYYHKLEIAFVLFIGIAFYIIFSKHDYNVNLKNLFGQKLSEKEANTAYIGKGNSGRIYYLKEKRLEGFFPTTTSENKSIIIKNVHQAKISNQNHAVAFVQNNELWILEDSSLTKRKLTQIEKWWFPDLRLTEKTKIKWSPDDDKIAFTSFDRRDLNYLLVFDMQKNKMYQLTLDSGYILDFLWDSKNTLCFTQLKSGEQKMFKIDADGGARNLID